MGTIRVLAVMILVISPVGGNLKGGLGPMTVGKRIRRQASGNTLLTMTYPLSLVTLLSVLRAMANLAILPRRMLFGLLLLLLFLLIKGEMLPMMFRKLLR